VTLRCTKRSRRCPRTAPGWRHSIVGRLYHGRDKRFGEPDDTGRPRKVFFAAGDDVSCVNVPFLEAVFARLSLERAIELLDELASQAGDADVAPVVRAMVEEVADLPLPVARPPPPRAPPGASSPGAGAGMVSPTPPRLNRGHPRSKCPDGSACRRRLTPDLRLLPV
jgi:hypothetical protein